jgi:hypothetical protein
LEPNEKVNPPELPIAMKELELLATPLVEWIRTTYGYNTDVVITADHVCVKQDGMSIPYPITEP